MADPFVAEIRIFPFNFAPRGWAWCDGQLLPLSQNTALFSLLGTTYGGNGKSNFALPDLQGSAPMHPGQGPGLSLHDLGETGGSETVTLLESGDPGSQPCPAGRPGRGRYLRPRSVSQPRRFHRCGGLPAKHGEPGAARPRGPHPRRRRPAAQQPAAVPDLLLLHRPPGGISAERVGRRSGTIQTTTRYLPFL